MTSANRPSSRNSKAPKRRVASGYLHGYSKTEQARLVKQARFLAPSVYESIDLSRQSDLLEVGCGVGAQTEILLERFPQLKITGVDAASGQIATARKILAKPVREKRVDLRVGDALNLPFSQNRFDSAFVCWLLEHVKSPIDILREIRRVLKPGGIIYCTEVLNATFFVHPYSPATLQYWFAFNDHQWSLKGDPFVGAKLANYLQAAEFQNVATEVKVFHYDNRTPKQRAEFIEYWTSLLLSGAPSLLAAKKVTQRTVQTMKRELDQIKDDPDAVFFYAYVQARAQVF